MMETWWNYDLDKQAVRARIAILRKMGAAAPEVPRLCGCIQVRPLFFTGAWFDWEPMREVEPRMGAMIEVLDPSERLTDWVAWPLEEPTALARKRGRADMLGEAALRSYRACGCIGLLHVFRTAESWLAAGGSGVVPLDPSKFAFACLDLEGGLLAEDEAHGRELDAAQRSRFAHVPQIMVPETGGITAW